MHHVEITTLTILRVQLSAPKHTHAVLPPPSPELSIAPNGHSGPSDRSLPPLPQPWHHCLLPVSVSLSPLGTSCEWVTQGSAFCVWLTSLSTVSSGPSTWQQVAAGAGCPSVLRPSDTPPCGRTMCPESSVRGHPGCFCGPAAEDAGVNVGCRWLLEVLLLPLLGTYPEVGWLGHM